jgi:hypothetical protein
MASELGRTLTGTPGRSGRKTQIRITAPSKGSEWPHVSGRMPTTTGGAFAATFRFGLREASGRAFRHDHVERNMRRRVWVNGKCVAADEGTLSSLARSHYGSVHIEDRYSIQSDLRHRHANAHHPRHRTLLNFFELFGALLFRLSDGSYCGQANDPSCRGSGSPQSRRSFPISNGRVHCWHHHMT